MPSPNRGRFAMRWESGLRKHERIRLHTEREALLAEMAILDGQLESLATRRREIVASLDERRERLWPRVEWCKGRRPPRDGHEPPPPLTDAHQLVSGRRLRSTCLAVLARHGRLTLRELHTLLHLYGYGIASDQPVKRLSDAMTYEVNCGRARRYARGVYETVAGASPSRRDHGGPLSGLAPPLPAGRSDPVLDQGLAEDPETWRPELRPEPDQPNQPNPAEPGRPAFSPGRRRTPARDRR
jgi:hypothetical protein